MTRTVLILVASVWSVSCIFREGLILELFAEFSISDAPNSVFFPLSLLFGFVLLLLFQTIKFIAFLLPSSF